MTAARTSRVTAATATEADYQATIIDVAHYTGWRVFHARPAQTPTGWRTALTGDAGWPDLAICGHGRLIVVELKAGRNKATPAQVGWLEALTVAGVDARLIVAPRRRVRRPTRRTRRHRQHGPHRPDAGPHQPSRRRNLIMKMHRTPDGRGERSNDFTRSVPVEVGAGRTLTGVAYRFDSPSLVADPGSSPYLEEFTSGAADNAIRQRGILPLMAFHHGRGRPGLPVGTARFRRGDAGLEFRVRVSKTPDGDEVLTLVNAGVLHSVSIRFRSVGARNRMTSRGRVTTHTEIALREMRTAGDELPGLAALRRRKALIVPFPQLEREPQ